MHPDMRCFRNVARLAGQEQEHTHRLAIGFRRHGRASALGSLGPDADADGCQRAEIAPAPAERDRIIDRAAAGIQYDGRSAKLDGPRAKSSKSFGVSAVTTPTALTQPRQFGWQATQVKRIGNLRSSSVAPPACAAPPSVAIVPGSAMKMAAAPSNTQPRKSSDPKNLKLVPSPNPKTSPNPKKRAVAMAQFNAK